MHLLTGEGCKSASDYRRRLLELNNASGYRRELQECIWLQERAARVHLVTGEGCKSALHECICLQERVA